MYLNDKKHAGQGKENTRKEKILDSRRPEIIQRDGNVGNGNNSDNVMTSKIIFMTSKMMMLTS